MNFEDYSQLSNVNKILSNKVGLDEAGVPCVYFLIDGSEIVYIGQTVNFLSRINSHKSDQDKKFDSYFTFNCESEHMDGLESFLIMYHQPKYNLSGSENSNRKFHIPMKLSEVIRKLI